MTCEARRIASIYENIKAGKYENKLVFYRGGEVTRDAYRKESADIKEKFRQDCEAAFQVQGHPKAGLLFSKAWEHGHSSGYSEVYGWYADLVELIEG